jgi:hypothetical protein
MFDRRFIFKLTSLGKGRDYAELGSFTDSAPSAKENFQKHVLSDIFSSSMNGTKVNKMRLGIQH